MKYVVIICDGMADFRVPQLKGKTPLEYAYVPNMNYLAQRGKVGLMKTIYEGLPVGSIVANMGILGYDPNIYYPNGRASFEALAQGIPIGENDIAFRCNLISVENGIITDFTSGNISDGHAKNIVGHLKIKDSNMILFPGQSYRNTLVVKNVNIKAQDILFQEPHRNIGNDIKDLMPTPQKPEAKQLSSRLENVMLESISQIKELNKRFNTKADMLWLWSPSSTPALPDFHERYSKSGAIVSAMDFLKGIGVSSQMDFEDIPDTNGYIDTNYHNKFLYAKKFLESNDFVYIHVNAPDEEGHNKNPYLKVKAIENIDSQIIGPLMLHLREVYQGDFKVAILPDHYTCVNDGHHYENEVPYLVYGKGISPDTIQEYTEKAAEKTKLKCVSYDFLDSFFS